MEPIENVADSVISEVRAINHQIVTDHGGNLASYFTVHRTRPSSNPRLVKSSKVGR